MPGVYKFGIFCRIDQFVENRIYLGSREVRSRKLGSLLCISILSLVAKSLISMDDEESGGNACMEAKSRLYIVLGHMSIATE